MELSLEAWDAAWLAGGPIPVNQFLGTSFMAGWVLSSPEDFNTQLGELLPRASARMVRRTGARPWDLLVADNAAMLALPPFDADPHLALTVLGP